MPGIHVFIHRNDKIWFLGKRCVWQGSIKAGVSIFVHNLEHVSKNDPPDAHEDL